MYGWTAQEAAGRSTVELLKPQFIGITREAAMQELEETGQYHGESFHQHKDGQTIPIEMRLTLLKDEENQVTGHLSVNRDITLRKLAEQESQRQVAGNAALVQALQTELGERKKTEEALRASTAKFESLFDSAPDPILLVDQDGNIERANRQVLFEFGYLPEELTGQNVEILIPPRFQKQHIVHRVAYQASPVTRTMGIGLELFGLHKGGYEFPVDVTLSPLEVGGKRQVICIIRNTTRYKEDEAALRKQDKLIQTAIAVAPIILFVTGREGSLKLVVGRPPTSEPQELESLVGKSVGELYAGRPDMLAMFQSVLGGEPVHTVLTTAKAIYDVYAAPLQDEKGEITGVVGTAMDISERVKTQAELAELQRRLIESQEAERLRISQDVHDGPIQDLIALSMQVKEIQDDLQDRPEVSALAELQEKITQVGKVLRLICGELRPPTLAPFGLEKTIRSHAERFQQEHPEFNLELELAPDGTRLDEQVRLALFRIYQQGMSNVLRHSRAKNVAIHFQLTEAEVCLEIQDDGVGFTIPERWIDFAREGHLGLAGMAERAEAIGGIMEISSSPGHGTRVVVTLPLTKKT
jgi:PAS domain S-box-containing protein